MTKDGTPEPGNFPEVFVPTSFIVIVLQSQSLNLLHGCGDRVVVVHNAPDNYILRGGVNEQS